MGVGMKSILVGLSAFALVGCDLGMQSSLTSETTGEIAGNGTYNDGNGFRTFAIPEANLSQVAPEFHALIRETVADLPCQDLAENAYRIDNSQVLILMSNNHQTLAGYGIISILFKAEVAGAVQFAQVILARSGCTLDFREQYVGEPIRPISSNTVSNNYGRWAGVPIGEELPPNYRQRGPAN
jgi:hypothetical protein